MFKNSRGETEIFVLVVVILGAFLLAGGQLLFQNNEDTSLSQPAAGGTNGGTTQPPAGSTDLIQVISQGCSANQGNATIAFKGASAGYISFGLTEANKTQFTKPYTPPVQSADLTLLNSDGFNTKPWQIQLFSGGTQDSTGKWSGGTSQAPTKDMPATGCP